MTQHGQPMIPPLFTRRTALRAGSVGLLGIVLTFSPEALYDFYASQPRYWGLSPVTDQNVGGALMALEQSLVMGMALVVLFIRQLAEAEREEQRAERYGAA